MQNKLPENIILVDKPIGITSFDVIRRLRKELGVKKMGHAGTLDPLASGLMIIGINDGTKKMEQFLKLDKTYIAEILLGTKTTTGDLEGEVLELREIFDLEEDYVREVVENFKGIFEIAVPKHSAIKRGGKPLYEYARENIEIEIPKKPMQVYKSKFRGLKKEGEGYLLKVEFDVASGVYIRSLAEYLGEFLDVPATLAGLQRTKIGEFSLKKARKI